MLKLDFFTLESEYLRPADVGKLELVLRSVVDKAGIVIDVTRNGEA